MGISNSIGRLALGMAIIGMSVTPLLAQEAPATAPAATAPAGGLTNGPTSGSDTQVKDSDVFGFDISMGGADLTPEQRLAARNTCNEKVMTNAVNYSGAVRTFCQQLQ